VTQPEPEVPEHTLPQPPAEPSIEITYLTPGDGTKVPEGARVAVHYKGMLLNEDGSDGKVFDSSYNRGQPFVFTLGQGSVIQGWEAALLQLERGQKASVTIPPCLAYGDSGINGVIPSNATLKFEMQVVDFQK